MCLCVSFGLSFIVLTKANPRLTEFKSTRAHWFFFAYLIFKGLDYLPFFLPLSTLTGGPSSQWFSLVVQVAQSAALTSAVWLVLRWRLYNKAKFSFTAAIAPLVVVWYLSSALPLQAEATWLPLYRCVVNVAATATLLWWVRNRQEQMLQLLRWCLIGWMFFCIIDYVGWDLAFFDTMRNALSLFVYWIAGVLALSITTIASSRFLIAREFDVMQKNGNQGTMLTVEWASILVAIILGWAACEAVGRNIYDDIVTNHSQKAVSDAYEEMVRIESQIFELGKIAESSGRMADFFASGNRAEQAKELVQSYTNGLDNTVCYVIDAGGRLVALIGDTQAEDATQDYRNKDYYRDALMGKIDYGYEKSNGDKNPAIFSSLLVKDPQNGKLLGLVVFKKFLKPGEVFKESKVTLIFDSQHKVILTSDPAYRELSENDFTRFEANDFKRFAAPYADTKLLNIHGNYYLYSQKNIDEEGSSIATLYEAKDLFWSCSLMYIALIWFIIFIVCIFVFSRYMLARSDVELEQTQEIHDILACTPNCVALLDKNQKIIRIEGSGLAGLMRSEEELLGKLFNDLWSKHDSFFVDEQLRRVFGGEKTTFEVAYRHPDGTPRYFSIFCGPLFNTSGKIEKIVTVWADVTRKKKIEKELRDRLQLEKTLSNITQEFLISASAENALKGALHSLLQFSNADRACWFEFKTTENAAECTLLDSLMTIDDKNQDIFLQKMHFDGEMANWRKLLETKQLLIVQDEINDSDIHEFLNMQKIRHMLAAPVFLEGKATGFIRLDYGQPQSGDMEEQARGLRLVCSTLQENLERWKTQENLQLLNTAVHATTDSILISRMFPMPGEIVFANAAATKNIGYSRDELLKIALSDLLQGPKNDPRLQEKIVIALNNKSHYRTEVHQRKKDGSEFLAETEAAPISDSFGNLLYAVITQRDITAKRNLESRASLSSKLESIGQLAAGIAHEINTPAQFIFDNLHFLKENWTPVSNILHESLASKNSDTRLAHVIKEIPEALADAIEGVKRISSIVQAMRQFSHSSSEKARADINNAISTTIVVGRNEWKYRADIATELCADLPLVNCYIGDINQVILNLVINAAHAISEKYAIGEKGHITIRTSHTPTHAIIQVEDDGTGIPDDIKNKIFDPFFTTKPQGKGTGQGLFIAHQIIVDKHQGSIEVDSTPGKGSTFTIKLPFET